MGIYRGKNFTPFNSYVISASTASANQVVVQPTQTGAGTIMPVQTPATDLMVSNTTGAVAYVAWGTTAQTATSSNVAVAAGAIEIFDMGVAATNVAVLLASGTGSVDISIGVGT